MTHILDMIAQQILILELKMMKQGQNKISWALIWGKVRLCRPNMTRDMIKKKKQGFSEKSIYATKMQNLTFFENHCFNVFYHIFGLILPTETYFTSN